MTAAVNASFEEAVDAIGEIILGAEFAEKLRAEHAKMRRSIPFRLPEWVYTEDIQTPGGYPCCELIALSITDDEGTNGVANLRHEISAQWTVNGDDEQTMGREVKRLIAATRATFRDITLLPYVGGSVSTGDADFGPVVTARSPGDTGRWVKSASISIFWRAFLR
jgi:hypothetical protein